MVRVYVGNNEQINRWAVIYNDSPMIDDCWPEVTDWLDEHAGEYAWEIDWHISDGYFVNLPTQELATQFVLTWM